MASVVPTAAGPSVATTTATAGSLHAAEAHEYEYEYTAGQDRQPRREACRHLCGYRLCLQGVREPAAHVSHMM